MRLHVYDAGTSSPVTIPSIASEARATDVEQLNIGDVVSAAAGQTPITAETTIGDILGVGDHGGNLIKHPCGTVTATIRYLGRSERLQVPPITLLQAVLKKAIQQFGIAPSEATTLTFRLQGNVELELELVRPIGTLTSNCEIILDLAHIVRPQG